MLSRSKASRPRRRLVHNEKKETKEFLGTFKTRQCLVENCFAGKMAHAHRRSPKIIYGTCFNYLAVMCGFERNKRGSCELGKKCAFAHDRAEVMFHPRWYKTSYCAFENCRGGATCPYAHKHGRRDLRDLKAIYGRNWQDLFQDPRPVRERNRRDRVRIRAPSKRVAREETCSPAKRESRTVDTAVMEMKTDTKVEAKKLSPKKRTPTTKPSRKVMVSPPVCVESVVSSVSPRSSVTSPPLTMTSRQDDEEFALKKKKENDFGIDFSMLSSFGSEFDTWFDWARLGSSKDRKEIKMRFSLVGMDNLKYLMDSCLDNELDFSSELAAVCGFQGGLIRQIIRKLRMYREPTDITGWLTRVVELPCYLGLFEKMGVEDVRDIGDVEMFLEEIQGEIALMGHWQRICFYLRKFGVDGSSRNRNDIGMMTMGH